MNRSSIMANQTGVVVGGDDNVSGGITWIIMVPVLIISSIVLAGGICMCLISKRNKRNNSINPHFADPDRTPCLLQQEIQKAGVPRVRVYPMNKGQRESFNQPKSITESRVLYPINESEISDDYLSNLTPINDDAEQVDPNPPYSPYHIAYVSPRLSNCTTGTSKIDSTTGSESLSLPSSISRYHQSKVPGFGTIGQSTSRLSYPIETIIESDSASSCDVYSDNTSLLPNVGSCPNSNSQVDSQENISEPSYIMPLNHASTLNPSLTSSMKTNPNESDNVVNRNRNLVCFTSSYDNTSEMCTSGPKEGSYLWDNYHPATDSRSSYMHHNSEVTGSERVAKSLDDVSSLSSKCHSRIITDRPLLKKEMYWV